MFKKIMALATLVCAVPALANAWTLSTWAKSGGGNITVTYGGNLQSTQTSVSGLKFKTYTTSTANPHNTVAVAVNANPGYYIYSVNGVVQTLQPTTYPTTVAGPTGGNVSVVFRPGVISVTATAGAGGTITPASVNNVYYGQTLIQKIKFTATPNPGFTASIVAPGCTVVNPTAANVAAYATIPAGTVMTQPVAVTASFAGVAANAGAPQTVLLPASHPLTLDGTASIGATIYNWTEVSGPAVVAIGTPTASKASFTPTAGAYGTYVFKLAIDGGASATTSVVAVNDVTVAAVNACVNCHSGQSVGATQNIYANWSSSIHSHSGTSICAGCHYGTNIGSHPGSVNAGTVNSTTFVVTAANGVVGGSDVPVAQGAIFCTACHNGSYPIPHTTGAISCQTCHSTSATSAGFDAHQIQPAIPAIGATCTTTYCHASVGTGLGATNAASGCVDCHALGITHPGSGNGGLVGDNSGVRAVTGVGGEFDASTRNNTAGYRSHHIYNGTGVDPQNAQCLACHLEGKVGPGRTVVIDPTYHMADAKVHLRSGNTAITPNVAWDPASPDQAGMDNFCMSCHNKAGAVSSYASYSSALHSTGMVALGGLSPSPQNPFGDMLKNAYDGLVRPQVVAVYEQFDTGNVSHHAVRGKKYTGRTRATAITANFTQYSGATIGNIHIIPSTGAPQVEEYFGNYSTSGPAAGFDGGKSSGSRKTLYEAGLFVAQYTTLSGTAIGDDSTLHCGDCHSVGQWKSGSANAVIFNNSSSAQYGYTIQPTTQVIGAHGSKNEYMLRTSNGSDALHTQGSTAKSSTVNGIPAYRASSNGTYVCYLCHLQAAYGDNNYFRTDAGVGVTSFRNHGGDHYSNGCDSSQQQSVGKVGYTARIGQVGSGTLGTVFGYTCAHCHNSGSGQVFGGIHGNSSTDGSQKNITFLSYSTDGKDIIGSTLPGGYSTRSYATEHDTLNAVARLPYRFMGGTGLRYNGGGSASKWEAKTVNGKHREGCYNLSATTATTNLWNTTNPIQSLAGGLGGNAIVNNNGNDSDINATDYTTRTAQNNQTTAGWGACNHHQGSTTTSSTAPTRSVQRPLVY